MPTLVGFHNYGGVPGLTSGDRINLLAPRLFNVVLNSDGTAVAQSDGIPPELVGVLRPAFKAILLQPNFTYSFYGANKELERHLSSYFPCGYVEKTGPITLKFNPADELAMEMAVNVGGSIVGLYASQTITGGGCQHGSAVIIPPESGLLQRDASALEKIGVHKGLFKQSAHSAWDFTFYNPAGIDILGKAPTAF